MRPKAEVGAMWTHTWVRFHCSFTHLHLGYSPVLSSEGKYTVPGHSSLTLRSKIQQSKHTQFILLCLDCEGGDSSLCGSSKAEQTRLPEFLSWSLRAVRGKCCSVRAMDLVSLPLSPPGCSESQSPGFAGPLVSFTGQSAQQWHKAGN